jgi:hypothetical protein
MSAPGSHSAGVALRVILALSLCLQTHTSIGSAWDDLHPELDGGEVGKCVWGVGGNCCHSSRVCLHAFQATQRLHACTQPVQSARSRVFFAHAACAGRLGLGRLAG